MRRPLLLVQRPGEVMPPEMGLFMGTEPPYDPGRADAESDELGAALAELGADPVSPCAALRTAPRATLAALAAAAVTSDDPDRLPGVRAALAAWSPADLAAIIVRRPGLRTHADPELAAISPDAAYESYELRPLFGLMFPRDHYVDLGDAVALGRLRRRDRARETAVVGAALEQLRGRPAELTIAEGDCLEGGDAAVVPGLAVLSCGFRTGEAPARLLRDHLLATGHTVVVVRDGLRRPEEFHLDHWLALGPGLALVAADRLDDPGVRATVHRPPGGSGAGETRVAGDDRALGLGAALAEAGVKVLPVGPDQVRRFAANVFFVPSVPSSPSSPGGEAAAVAATAAHADVAPLLEAHGVRVVGVPFDEHHKLFGSIHCAVNSVPLGGISASTLPRPDRNPGPDPNGEDGDGA
jgi:N-dimethylarginine dimethylaminohydrolase